MAARAVRVLRVTCPACGEVCEVQLDEETLAAARSSPTGLAGVADFHGDHILVLYIDADGRDRGVRVYRALQRWEVIRVNPSFLSYMSEIRGFRVSAGSVVECFQDSPRAFIKVVGKGVELEAALRSFEHASHAVAWMEEFLEGLRRGAGDADLGTLLLSILVLDSCLPLKPLWGAARAFEAALRSRRLVIRVDEAAAELFRLYAERITWLYAGALDAVLRMDGWRLIDALVARDAITVRERLFSILALERRGVVRLEVVA
ncbi:MAG: hypothetical protein DRJ67_02845 [Thermoprotei archaeon]|nr:MAG: hypothetical protein DRJ67_02845 [Thermoprotei archaeon]